MQQMTLMSELLSGPPMPKSNLIGLLKIVWPYHAGSWSTQSYAPLIVPDPGDRGLELHRLLRIEGTSPGDLDTSFSFEVDMGATRGRQIASSKLKRLETREGGGTIRRSGILKHYNSAYHL